MSYNFHLVTQDDFVVQLHLTSQGLQGLQVFIQRVLGYGCAVHPALIEPVQPSAMLQQHSRPCRNTACLQLLASKKLKLLIKWNLDEFLIRYYTMCFTSHNTITIEVIPRSQNDTKNNFLI